MKHIFEDPEGVHQLGMLAKVIADKACEIAKQYEKDCLDKGKTIPINELYNYETLKMVAPGHDLANKPRS